MGPSVVVAAAAASLLLMQVCLRRHRLGFKIKKEATYGAQRLFFTIITRRCVVRCYLYLYTLIFS